MANLDNLTPFQKGRVKTGGKQKGYCSPVAELRKLLEKKISYEDPTTKTHVQGKIGKAIALRAIYNALEGDQKAIEDIMDRIDGKTAQKILSEMSGEVKLMGTIKVDGRPLEVKVGT